MSTPGPEAFNAWLTVENLYQQEAFTTFFEQPQGAVVIGDRTHIVSSTVVHLAELQDPEAVNRTPEQALGMEYIPD